MPFPPRHSARWIIPRILAGICLLLLAIASCRATAPLSLTPDEKAWLAAHKETLEAVLKQEAPPYSFTGESGTNQGLFVDYLSEIEEILGVRFTIRHVAAWEALVPYVQSHRDFVVFGTGPSEDRNPHLRFTTPLITMPYALVTRKGSGETFIAEFAGRRLCTVTGYAVNEELRRHFPHVPTSGISGSIQGLHAVASGTCDAMVLNQLEATYLIDHLGLANLQIVAQTQFLNRLCLATSINDPILFGIMEKALTQITTRQRRSIYRRWVNPGDIRLPDPMLITIQVGAGLILCVIFILWAWTTSLRQQVEKQTRQLRESNENLRITLDSIGDGVLATDTAGRITHLNPAAEALTGWSLPEANGKAIDEVIRLREIDTNRPLPSAERLASAEEERESSLAEAILISRNGLEYRIHNTVSPIRDDKGITTGSVWVLRNVTDRVKAEEKLLQIKKLDSLGILAGGIAHDFNNLLTGLYGNISMASLSLPDGHEALSYLTSAEKSMEAAAALTSQFLTFSKNEKPVKKIIDLGKTLEEAATFATHGLNTRLVLDIDTELWHIEGDKGQLTQVVGNLIINAHQAMPTGGIITITAKNCQEPAGRSVRIAVTDTGTGIPPENLDRIFDPYFSTKKKGTGLGLATTHSIITKHNGSIQVDSKLGVGTTFTITLPVTSEPLDVPVDKGLEKLIDTHALKAHILVLDDQVVIRKILETILGKLGLSVTFTVEGSETVAAYRERLESGKPYDAVVLDLTIPGGMGGHEASQKILAMDPKARIIISSGYARDPIMAHYESYGIKAVAAKPYRFNDFKEILLRVLMNNDAKGNTS